MDNLENTNNEATVETGAEQETKTYTEQEVQELLQREGDRRVSAALKKAEQKNASKVREAEKLASMSAEEKYRYELDQREAAIAAKEQELALAENKNACAKVLSEKGLSLELVDFVVDTDAEVMSDKIKALDKAFKASVKAEVEKRLGSNIPKKNLPMDSALTKEQFAKLSLSELQRLANEQPEIFNQFKQQ